MKWIAAALTLVLFSACADDSPTLWIDLVTDLRPGVDFTAATIRVEPAGGGSAEMRQYVYRGESGFDTGARLAEFSLPPGDYEVAVTLLGSGATAATQNTLVAVSGDRVITVVISRSCVDVTCPMAAQPSATSCLGGRCVDPECVVVEAECAVECTEASECADIGCASPVCSAGTCLYYEDDSRCDEGRCDIAFGCVDESMDAGADSGPMLPDSATPDVGVDAGVDAGSDAGTDAGTDASPGFDGGPDTGPVACPERWPDPPSCDPQDSSGCSASRTCTPDPRTPGTTFCQPTGGRGLGETCGGSSRCERGLVCQAFVDATNPRCRAQCAAGAGCTCPSVSDTCFALEGTSYGACRSPCDPIAGTGCPAGDKCVRSVYGTSCERSTGNAGEGESCSVFTDCAPGGYCLVWNGVAQCLPVCLLGGDDCSRCRSDGSSTVYGFCVP